MTSNETSQEWLAAEQVKAAWRSAFQSRESAGAETVLNRAAIDAATRALENVQEFVSPQMARSIQASINFKREIGRDYGLLTEYTVREALDIDSLDPMPRMFGISYCGEMHYPAFLFEPSPTRPGKQRLKPVVAELGELADKYNWEDSDVAFWLATPTTWFDGGGKPVDYMDDPEKVLDAFKDSADVQW